MRTRSEQIKASRAPKPVAKPNIKDYPNTKEGLARYDKALAAYNRYVKATGKPTPQTAQKAAQSGQYGRYAKPSNQVKLTPAKSADTKSAPKPASKPAASKPAPKPASKPAPAKPAAKPASKPTAKPAAKAKEYYGPGGKPKRPSLKEQVADLKKSGTGSQRFKEMAEKARKEMMEKRRKDLEKRRKNTQQRGSRKPGSMY